MVVAGAVLAVVAVSLDARVGTHAAPFTGRYRLQLAPASLLAPAVALAVLWAWRAGVTERVAWRWLLLGGFGATAVWTLALALVEGGAGLAHPLHAGDGLLADVPLVGNHPGRYLRHYVDLSVQHSAYARQHPPGPVLLLWALGRLGLTRPGALGLVLALVGCLSVPLVAVSVRSLCHEPAARRLLPALVLAPYAVWVAVSPDAVTLTLAAAAIACGVVGSEPGRSPLWALGCGVLLGVTSLFSYAGPWLALTVVVTYFVRRRALLNVLTGLGVLAPLWLVWLAGFVWPDGLSAAQSDFATRIAPHRSWSLWVFLDLMIVAVACGPVLVTALRKVRRTPGWPFLVGAGLAIGFELASGLSRGEAERALLPFLPWLLVPAVAPEVRPAVRGQPLSAALPLGLVAAGAAAAVVLEAVLRSPS